MSSTDNKDAGPAGDVRTPAAGDGASDGARDGAGGDDVVRRIANELPVGVWVARVPGGELVYANRTFAEIMGMEARDDVAVGEYAQPYGICTRSGEPYPEHKLPFVQAMEARDTVVVDDIVIHRRDGGRVYVRATAKPLWRTSGDGKREMEAISIAFIDISREVLAEKAHKESEAREQVARRMQALGKLASGVAHDFNNMLAVVKALAQLLQEGELDEGRKADLVTIDEVTKSAVELTRQILNFGGGGPARSEDVDVDAVARRVGRMLERVLDRRITLRFQLESASLVHGDAHQLEQVLLNLVTNARDAMKDGGAIEVRTRRSRVSTTGSASNAGNVASAGNASDEERVIIEVDDEGPGIPVELRARVFEPYFTTKQPGPERGAGLGLATVYGIVARHGGTIELVDGRKGGALFRISLPRLGPVADDAARAAELHDEPLPRGEGVVLVVDDEGLVRAVAARSLETLGYTVLCATSGEEALRILDERRDVRVVMLDLIMPGLSGAAAFRALQAKAPNARIVLTSGTLGLDEDGHDIDDGKRALFLPKPWSLRDLAVIVSIASGRT